MKFVGAFFYCLLLHLFMQINGNKDILVEEKSSQHVTTIVGVVNETFTWKIKNYHLIPWELAQNPQPVIGPTFTAKDGKKVGCIIEPFYTPERMKQSLDDVDIRATPKLVCKFSPQPSGFKYSFEHGEGIITNGAMIYGVYSDEIKIIIDAFYAKNDF